MFGVSVFRKDLKWNIKFPTQIQLTPSTSSSHFNPEAPHMLVLSPKPYNDYLINKERTLI